LIFFSPSCGHCTKMLPALAALPTENGHTLPVVVSTGDPETNRALFEQHGIRTPVLLQESGEIAGRYLIRGTPTGYLIDPSGTIASDLARGADALLALAAPDALLFAGEAPAPKKKGGCGCGGSKKANGNKPLEDSRLERTGLKPGTPAPSLRLPLLDGGEVAIEDLRGRRVLLVFSDPECGPCDELAPRLELLHRDRPDLRVMMIGRRDPELIRAKAAKFGLTFPIAMQKNWEVSLQFGIFATPVAFLIDEEGIVAAGVAKGVQPILDLAVTPGVPSQSLPRHTAVRGEHVTVN
jgi:peroxiredoxin